MVWYALRFFIFEKMDLRNCIKFCVKNETKCAKTFKMLTVAFGVSTISRTQVQLWYNRFMEGRQNVNEHVNNRWKHCSSEGNDFR